MRMAGRLVNALWRHQLQLSTKKIRPSEELPGGGLVWTEKFDRSRRLSRTL
jgi:hypothetical protein